MGEDCRAEPFDGVTLNERERARYEAYYVFAREFGWTPEQVDDLPVTVLVFLLNKIREERERIKRISG